MLGNRKDPLADVVKKVMDHNENERRIIAEFNSELGIKDRRQLPHEKRAAYDQALSERLNEATSPENYSAKQKQLAANAGDPKKIDAADLKKVRMQGHIEEEGSVPTTAREKDLAAMKPPHDKITHADVLKGRGVIKQEEKEYKGDEAPFEADEKKSTPWTNPKRKAKNLAREMMKQMKAKKEKKLDEEQIDEVSTEKLVAYMNKAGEGREKGSKLAYAKLTGKAKVKASMPKTPYMEEDIQQSGKEKPPVSTIDRMKDPNPPEKYTPKFGAENPNIGTKASAEDKAALQKKIEDIKEATYSAKAARAGKDIGKPGKMFSKIAKKAGEKYGSEEKGKKVAGAVLAKIRAKHMKEEEQIDEKTLTSAETSKKEELVKKMKKGDWSERYGKRGKEVMYATATKMAKKLAEEEVSIESIQEEIRTSLLEKANWLKENGTQEQVVEFLNNLTMEQREILNLAERVVTSPNMENRGAFKPQGLGPSRKEMGDTSNLNRFNTALNTLSNQTSTSRSVATPSVEAQPVSAKAPEAPAPGFGSTSAVGMAKNIGGAPQANFPAPKAPEAPAPGFTKDVAGLAGVPSTPKGFADTQSSSTSTPAPAPKPAAPTPSTSSVDTSGGSRYGKGGGLEYADRHQVYESKSGKSLEKFLKEDFNGKKS